jgi:hypothetical protein
MSIAWHCDFEDCDEWASRGSDEARDWVITTHNGWPDVALLLQGASDDVG